MKIVLTGALGHIGSRVSRDLPSQFPDAEILLIDNMMTQRYASLFNMPAEGRYRFMEADITSMDLRKALDGAHAVIHLAAITDAAGTYDKADLIESNNYQATLKIAEACVQTGSRLLALSSTSVYSSRNAVVSEDCPPEDVQPQSPYAATKLKEENLVKELCLKKGLQAISCRFGTIFGTSQGMRFHTAVNKFCWQAVMRQPIGVWRTALDQKRPYLDLADASRAIAFILRENLFDGGLYNVVTLNTTVRQITDTIKEFVPGIEIGLIDSPIMNNFSYEVSTGKFENTGFRFSGDLRKGVGDTIALLHQANTAS